MLSLINSTYNKAKQMASSFLNRSSKKYTFSSSTLLLMSLNGFVNCVLLPMSSYRTSQMLMDVNNQNNESIYGEILWFLSLYTTKTLLPYLLQYSVNDLIEDIYKETFATKIDDLNKLSVEYRCQYSNAEIMQHLQKYCNDTKEYNSQICKSTFTLVDGLGSSLIIMGNSANWDSLLVLSSFAFVKILYFYTSRYVIPKLMSAGNKQGSLSMGKIMEILSSHELIHTFNAFARELELVQIEINKLSKIALKSTKYNLETNFINIIIKTFFNISLIIIKYRYVFSPVEFLKFVLESQTNFSSLDNSINCLTKLYTSFYTMQEVCKQFYKLLPTVCELILMDSKPSSYTLDSIKNVAYIQYKDRFYYINKCKSECIEIHTKQQVIMKLIKKYSLNYNVPKSLSNKELSAIKADIDPTLVFENIYTDKKTPLQNKANHALEFRKISFFKELPITKDKSNDCKIIKGSKVLVIGPSGIGKTTLFRSVMHFAQPNSGDILFFGEKIKKISKFELRSKIGYLPQTTKLRNESLYNNITYALEKNRNYKQEITDLINTLGLHNEKFLNNFEAIIGNKSDELNLSGGQQQVVCLLRVLIRKKQYSVFLFDESFSSMDTVLRKKIISGLMKLFTDSDTVLFISHLEAIKNEFKFSQILDFGNNKMTLNTVPLKVK